MNTNDSTVHSFTSVNSMTTKDRKRVIRVQYIVDTCEREYASSIWARDACIYKIERYQFYIVKQDNIWFISWSMTFN